MTDNKIPETEEPRLGLDESMYYAQIIVNSFAKGLQERQCMSRIPIAVYTEAELYEDRLIDTLSYFGDSDSTDPLLTPVQTYTYTAPTSVNNDKSEVQTPTDENISLEAQTQANKWSDSCYDCSSEIPELNLDQIFDSILYRIREFIDQIKNLFDLNLPNFCQFSYLLSYACIPDLVAILAIILAAILKLISSIFLGTFSILSFVLGIIQMIIGQLLRYVLAMIRYALKPITCLLDTLAEIANSIPTNESLEKRLSEDEYQLLYGKPSTGDSKDLPSAVLEVQKVVNGISSDVENSIKDVFASISTTVEGAAEAVDDSIEDLFGLVSYLECEPGRSGISVFGKIEEIMNLVQISNLIMAIIDKKAEGTPSDKLCREDSGGDYYVNDLNTAEDGGLEENQESISVDDYSSNSGFTPLEIAEVIQTAIGIDTSLVIDDKTSLAVGLLINRDREHNTRLSMFSCNLPEIIKDYTIERIINRTRIIPNEYLFGDPRGIPRARTIEKVTTSSIKEIVEDGEYQFLPIDIIIEENTDGSVRKTIKELISNRRKPTEIEDDIDKIDKPGIKDPDILPSTEDYSLGIIIDGAIPSSVFENKTSLKCGSVLNIKEQFLSLGEE